MTLEQLTNLTDEELGRMAAERIYGWTSCRSQMQARGETEERYWQTSPGKLLKKAAFTPATDRNQSGELLVAMAARKWQFWVAIDSGGACSEVTGISHGLLLPEVHVPGNSARSETIAALLAHFAMEDKSHA